jgi:3'-phosphoadenosine 5'-phosphosulfate sulfotransferase (PAPS reductase)/FAD synthetase
MEKKVRHVLGISGGKDSAALAIYMKDNYPDLDIEYYTCDTGKELGETYQLIKNLENYLGKKIIDLRGAENSHEDPFDHFLKMYGGYLPSSNARWCTKKLKLDPFEKFVGDDPVISYVGIRGDEDREGYISKKSNIQSIFPFRKNIWSEDVVNKFLANNLIEKTLLIAEQFNNETAYTRFVEILNRKTTPSFTLVQKMNLLLDTNIILFNKIAFEFLKSTAYPLATEKQFDLISNEDVLVRADIFKLLEDTGVGVPAYYKEVEFEVNGVKATYARSRSGCFFCFFQQKIEWIWLYEQHPDLYMKAIEYEKDGYTWMQSDTLQQLIEPDRIVSVKEEYIKRTNRIKNNIKSPYLLDILADAEAEGCASCFI